MKIGDKILLEDCQDLPNYNGRVGVIHYIDDFGFMAGTWGDEILNEEIDKIKKIGYEAVSEKEIYLAEMSSKQIEAKGEFNGKLKQGIRHLIKIYCYRNNDQYMRDYKNHWVDTVQRNISCDIVNNKGESCLTSAIADGVIKDNLSDTKFHNHFIGTINDCEKHNYNSKINPKDEEGSKLFVYKYLDWAKTILLEKTEIDEGEVTKKINTMLKELQK